MAAQTQKYNKLAGKHVLIVGGTSESATPWQKLASNPSHTLPSLPPSADRVKTSISSLQSSYPSTSTRISGYACDLSKPTLGQNIEQLFEKTGKVDHILFTAGDPLATIPLDEISFEKILKAGQVRFFAPLMVAKVGNRYLNPGPESSIVLTAGSVAEKPSPNWSIVASYASGLYGMTRNLAMNLKPIRVNLVSPRAVDTELWKWMSTEQKEAFFKQIAEKVVTGRVRRPEDVAEAYLWLMKDSNVTGFVAATDSGSKLV
ncbi:related to enoyl-[acyl-carrier-protein] reductase 1 [Phialocephala subalpina]|uniref:Related to enoyl-[acyl-carrier-protein] reductase 1 n=1 Tax=Phialocephala subalpina TaxID=576137 RepID=A0A1L7XX36_9HELO|nr:related to enoyl-[acyl-carrier-protein] reductase 1 [Phialocephala subalpina]